MKTKIETLIENVKFHTIYATRASINIQVKTKFIYFAIPYISLTKGRKT